MSARTDAETLAFVSDAIGASSAYAQQPRGPSVSRRVKPIEQQDKSSVFAALYPGGRVSGGADVDPDELAAAGL